MHNHNNEDGGHNGMLWMMIPCLLLLGFLFFGGDTLSSSKYLWLIVAGVCIVPHMFMMFKGHGGHGNAGTNREADDASIEKAETKNDVGKNSHSGHCH